MRKKSLIVLLALSFLVVGCGAEFDDKCTIQNLKKDGQYFSVCNNKKIKVSGVYSSSVGLGSVMNSYILYNSPNSSNFDTFGGIMQNNDFIPYKKGDSVTLVCTLSNMLFKDCYYVEK